MNIASPETIRRALQTIPAHERDLWVRMGQSVKSALGDAGFEIWDEWSKGAENYDPRAAKDVWRSINAGGGVTVGTLFYEAKQRGFRLNGETALINAAEIEHYKRERAAAIEKEEEERKQRQAQAVQWAAALWNEATPLTRAHPYLTRKGVSPTPTMREILQAHAQKLLGYTPKADGEPLQGRLLLLPVKAGTPDESRLTTAELIDEEGRKTAIFGGAKAGGYWAAQALPEPSADVTIAIGEGAATVLSVRAATGFPVVAALTAGNLPAVASTMREAYPDARLIVLGDLGNGENKAREAAAGARALLTLPDFGPGAHDGNDFNDMANARGLEAVQKAIEAGKQIPPDAQAQASAKVSGSKFADTPEDDGAAEADGWPKPQPLPEQLPAVLPFSFDLLPDELREWIKDIAERVQCPPEFPAVAAIIALGSVIGRKLAVRPKHRDDWEEFPNLWGVIIGSPGVLKTPALMEALRPLRALEARALEHHGADLATWQAERAARKVKLHAATAKARDAARKNKDFDAAALVVPNDEDEPQPRRYIVNDSSIEALGMVLQASPNGVLAYRDELIGLLKSLDREGMEGARAFYLSAYSGKEAHVYDRIGRGLNIRVDHVCVSMLGSIQPSVIGRYLREAFDNGGDDGLLSRFSLLVWPDVSSAWQNVDRWPDTSARRAANALFERMDALDPLAIGAEIEEGEAPFLRLSDAARAAFVEWREAFEQKQRDNDEHPALVAHFAKYRKLVPTLALIFHLASRGTGPVSEPAMVRALAWSEVLQSHARRAYASVQQVRTEAARALMAKIRAGAVGNPIRPRDVYLKGWSGLSDREDVRHAIELLEELDYLRAEILQTPGRSKTVYWINPRGRA